MAKAKLTDIDYLKANFVKQKHNFRSKIFESLPSTTVKNITKLNILIKQKNIFRTKVFSTSPSAKVESFLPFYIKIENIGLATYNSENPAPIGIQIIGFNNYIL